MRVAIVWEQGHRRSMEDTYFLDLHFSNKDWVFGGVYDGHGGAAAARYLARHLHERFLQAFLTTHSPCAAFIHTYEQISEELHHQTSGACAANFLLKEQKIFYANAGDARILVISPHQILQLTTDHRLDNAEERQRIREAGGEIQGPYVWKPGVGGLMPTRTIGDQPFKSVGVIATPAVGSYTITEEDLFLIAATDGLFDIMHNDEVATLARAMVNPEQLANALAREVLVHRYGEDNLTIIVFALQKEREEI